MANYFNFELRVKGTQEAIDKFLSYTHAFGNTPPENKWLDLSEIFYANVEPADDGRSVYADFSCGNSKGPWSELIDADDAYPGAVSLYDITEELRLMAEMYIDSDEWATHLIIDSGQEMFCEERENYDPIWEVGAYETFDDWRREYNMPEGTTLRDVLDGENKAYGEDHYDINMTWDEFVKEMEDYDGECFHFGGFGGKGWTI